MAFEDIKSYIEGVTKAHQITWVNVRGGEPFLLYDTAIETLNFSKKKGIPGKVTTFGFWASDSKKAGWIVRNLKQAGVDHVEIRHDSLCNEQIDIARVTNAAAAVRNEGLVLEIRSTYLHPLTEASAGKGPYEGETDNDADAKTKEIQNQLSDSLPKRCIIWDRAVFPEDNSPLESLLGDHFEDAKAASKKAYSTCENANGKIDTAVEVNIFPDGELVINQRPMGNARKKEVDIMVRDFLIEARMAF